MSKKTFTLYLAKDDVENFEDLLSEGAQQRLTRQTTRIVDAPDFAQGARVYIFVGDDLPPRWLLDLRRYFPVSGRIENSSSCALLIFRQETRIFAATFAHAWMYLNESNFEGDFGLRVALNALNDTKLKRLERANLGDALRGISLSSFQRDFASFGLDDALDLVRKISGSVKDDAIGEALTGARSYRISGEFAIPDLPALASDALRQFSSTAYKSTSFRVIDVVIPVTDPRLVSELDKLTVHLVKAESGDFELCLPVSYEDDEVAYRFQGAGLRGRFPDLLLRNYTTALGNNLVKLDAPTLRDHKVVAVYDDDSKPDRKWSIRTALIGTIMMNDGRYATNEGEWYRIDETFRNSIEETYRDIVNSWERRPRPLRKIFDSKGNGVYQSEASYNDELAADLSLVLLDQTTIEIPGVQRSGFEPCDLLDIHGKRFIHLKKSSRRSNILSHFFKQGANSAQNFKGFPAAWDQLLKLVRGRAGDASAADLLAAFNDESRKWSVEFWIADAPRPDGRFNIPFFSKISLRDEAARLRAMDYRVAVRFIGVEP